VYEKVINVAERFRNIHNNDAIITVVIVVAVIRLNFACRHTSFSSESFSRYMISPRFIFAVVTPHGTLSKNLYYFCCHWSIPKAFFASCFQESLRNERSESTFRK